MKKGELRGKGDGFRISVKGNTSVDTKFSQFIKTGTLRAESLTLAADWLVKTGENRDTNIVSIRLEKVVYLVDWKSKFNTMFERRNFWPLTLTLNS